MLLRVRFTRIYTHTMAPHPYQPVAQRKETREKYNQKKNVVPTTTEWQSSDVLVLLFFFYYYFPFFVFSFVVVLSIT